MVGPVGLEDETVRLLCRVIEQGDKATKVRCYDTGEQSWVPHRLIHVDSDLWEESYVKEDGYLEIPLWLAERDLGWRGKVEQYSLRKQRKH